MLYNPRVPWPPALPPADRARVDVVALGENSVDFVAVASGGAPLAGKRSLASFDTRTGGQAATAAIGCARQGLRSRYVGALGADAWGARVHDALAREGVDVRIRRPAAANRIAVIVVEPDGDRLVYERRDPALKIDDARWIEDAVRDARVLLVDATDIEASIVAARAARAAGVPVIVDVDRPGDRTDDLLAAIDVIVAPAEFMTEYSGRPDLGHALEWFDRQFGAAVVVATCGPDGSLARQGGREWRTPGFAVDVVDTTGAGDAFRAGFCAGWLRSADAPVLPAVLRWANATAALNCTALGAQTGLPDGGSVERLVASAGPGALPINADRNR